MAGNFVTVIEVQFLKNKNGDFWIKELCVLKDGFKAIYVFLPPHSWSELPDHVQRENRFIEDYLHQLVWEEGTTDYANLKGILLHLTEDSKFIFTKGEEKAKILSEILERDIVDMTLETPSYQIMAATRVMDCIYRKHNNKFCAFVNAHKLFDFIKENHS